MHKNRLEAFSDGVLAIIITIMVLELKVPHGDSLAALQPLLPVFLSYILSFINVGIYWNNHHNMLHQVTKVNGTVLWANSHLLFWLSLFPFVTAWMGENHFSTWPVAFYGFVSMMAGFAYFVLAHCLTAIHGSNSSFAKALGNDWKGKVSVAIYALGIVLSFIQPFLGIAAYVIVSCLWFIPDTRFERKDQIE
jgi:uncharacterized membrane protein